MLILNTVYSETMNGVDYKKYKDFFKTWPLITARYRSDTNEMRFTYANKLAADALNKEITDYPNGAIFGKVGVMTGPDPAFESSQVPLGARRYQFMIRNKKKYKATGGWGFALFDANGNRFPEDETKQVESCFACHNIVQERGYVFSQPMDLSGRKPLSFKNKLQFETLNRDDLPESLAKLIPEPFKFIRSLKGILKQKIFQGTLEEIRPTLSREAFESKYPTILISEDKTRWSLVYPEQLGAFCVENNKQGLFMHSVYTKEKGNDEKHDLHFCYTP